MSESIVEYLKRGGPDKDFLANAENHIRNMNYVANLKVAMNPNISPASAAVQIARNDRWTESVIQMNNETFKKKK